MEQKVALCRWCHNRCRVRVHTENGRLVKIDEDRTDPRIAYITPPSRECTRLPGAKEYVYHPERVRFPLKRKGEKGEGKWQQISWDQAVDEIASKLSEIRDKYGAESLMQTQGTGRTDAWAGRRFLNLFGSPNIIGQAAICFGPWLAVTDIMVGWPLRHLSHAPIGPGSEGKTATKCLLSVGENHSESQRFVWNNLIELKKLGMKVIAIDPRKTRTAEVADIWLQHRPGTDAALLMAMVNVIIKERLYDKEFVEKWCYGFDKLAERTEAYSPEKVADITWVPARKIREAAHMFASERPGVVSSGEGLEQLENSIEALQALIALAAINGDIDVEGGNYLPGPMGKAKSNVELELDESLSPEQRKKQIGADRFKLFTWPGDDLIQEYNRKFWGSRSRTFFMAHYPSVLRAIITGKPYPVRAGITTHSNPIVTQGNSRLVYKALKSLDLYVVKDFWLTPSAELADYVLPSACWLERPDMHAASGTDTGIMAGYPVLPAIVLGEHEYWTEYDFFCKLGRKMGQQEFWPWNNLEEARDYQLKPLGLTYMRFMEEKNGLFLPANEYRKHEKKGGFGTPTGKIELYSTILEKLGYDPLPRYDEPSESSLSRPDLAEEFPLTLINGGRVRPYFQSEHRQIDSMRKRHPNPLLQIHPQTAQKLGIDNGDWVWIETPSGRIRQKSLYFEGIDPRVVHAEHGWWFPELPGEEPWLHGVWESNVNVLTDDSSERCNKVSGGWPLRTNLCKVYKVKTF